MGRSQRSASVRRAPSVVASQVFSDETTGPGYFGALEQAETDPNLTIPGYDVAKRELSFRVTLGLPGDLPKVNSQGSSWRFTPAPKFKRRDSNARTTEANASEADGDQDTTRLPYIKDEDYVREWAEHVDPESGSDGDETPGFAFEVQDTIPEADEGVGSDA